MRERKDDLALLAEDILGRLSPDKPIKIAPAALAALMAYDFPGNVRELRNILERATILADGDTIETLSFPDAQGKPAQAQVTAEDIEPLAVAERRYLESVLARLDGDKGQLAKRLGISRRTIDRKLQSG